VNTHDERVLRGLFQGVAISSHYDPAQSSDSMVDAAGASAMATEVLSMTQADRGGLPLRNRTKMTGVGALHTAWTSPNEGNLLRSDAALESVFGKTAGLMTIRQNYFLCFLAVQKVKDIGAPEGQPETMVNGVPCRLGRFDPGGDRILATQRAVVVLYRDAVLAKTRVERFYYLD